MEESESTSAQCRILVVSPSLQHAFHFIHRVKMDTSASIPNQNDQNSERSIPWTISNKYYKAHVHFQAHEIRFWSSTLADGVPAIIFVWGSGEPYKEHVQYLSKEMASHDPEVSLAVRLQQTPSSDEQDEEGLDEFLSNLGFEFVNVNDGASVHDRNDELLSSGIPGLPRAIDALSTIMWPSMVRSTSTSVRKSKAHELLDWAYEEEDEDGLRAIVDQDRVDSINNDEKSRMQKEMEQLERWLQEDEPAQIDEDPWNNVARISMKPLADPLAINDSPMGMDSPHAPPWQETTSRPVPHQLGFDDDFTVFISAPAEAEPGLSASGRSTPNASFDPDRLEPMHTGASYASLGSVSDFGENEAKDDADADLPSKAEIQASSDRIFGSAPSLSTSKRPAALFRGSSSEEPTVEDRESTPHVFSTTFNPDPDASDPSLLEMEDDDYEVGNFDLSRVLNALQNMKEEIAGMEDEGERRKAAARAALGLVYGLERQRDEDDDGNRAA